MFELRNLDVGYMKNLLISRANIIFQGGHVYSISGDNGIGKTTLMKTLVGFIKPINGVISLEKESISDWSLQDLSRHFSVLFSRHDIDSSIKVNEIFDFSFGNIENKIDLKKMSEQFFEYFSINYLMEKPFGVLSDGQKQLILLARSLIKPANIYLLDEPTIYLDIKTKKKLVTFIRDHLIDSNKVVVLISHDADFVSSVSDVLLEIKNGTLNHVEKNR